MEIWPYLVLKLKYGVKTKIPDLKDEIFVLNDTISCESVDPYEQDLKIAFSTLTWLENLKKSKMIQIDVTYKVI